MIPFFTAGYPNISSTINYVKAAENCGADIVELGIPFSDPMADGPEIQFSSKVALDNNISLSKILELVGKIRKFSQIPIVLMGYYNPIYAYGESKFFKDAQNSGVDGLIIPDLIVEESYKFKTEAEKNKLSMTYLVSPTSKSNRVRIIDKASTDFVYAVTVTGVTGTGKKFDKSTDMYLKNLKNSLSKRFVAGFGVSSPDTAKRLTKYSDGVVIGSALIKIIKNSKSAKDSIGELEKFLKSVRKAI